MIRGYNNTQLETHYSKIKRDGIMVSEDVYLTTNHNQIEKTQVWAQLLQREEYTVTIVDELVIQINVEYKEYQDFSLPYTQFTGAPHEQPKETNDLSELVEGNDE